MIKVRLAPSPTGFLHIGTAQSALYNWLFARKNGGGFYLRIEDTDKERSNKEFEQSILEALRWLDLRWDGDVVHQSSNVKKHEAALKKLLKEDKAFYCYHTQEELEIERKEQEALQEAPRHICQYKNNDKGQKPSSKAVIRLKVDKNLERKIIFDDQIRGKIEFRAALLGDFSIARAVDDPLYNFAVVVDDIEMEITHVIRGEDHISNTPKQMLIYGALGKEIPVFAHLPLILASDRSKLSKRHGAVAVADYKKDYLPEAIVNFLGGLSYTFSKEILTKEEMIGEFKLEKVHKSGAIFNIEKLNWVNSQYIKNLNISKFKQIVLSSSLTDSEQSEWKDLPDAAIPIIIERLEKLSDIQNFNFFWKDPEYNEELLKWKNSSWEDVKKSLKSIANTIEDLDFKSEEILRIKLDDLGKSFGDRGLVYWPLRVALTGKEKSPDPVEIAFILGKEETLKRVSAAIAF